MRTAVITPAAGRHRHLALQHLASRPVRTLRTSTWPSRWTIRTSARYWPAGSQPRRSSTARSRTGTCRWPRARNLGAARALERGAELLVFLDVDCVPGEQLLERYRQVALDVEHQRSLLCGTVSYLPPPSPYGYRLAELPTLAEPHSGRPAPGVGELHRSEDYALFWSLPFAVTAET